MLQNDISGGSHAARDRIITAASALFIERGYQATDTLSIATRAHVSKRDLYAQFGSKLAMLGACIADGAARMEVPLQAPPPRDRADLLATLIAFGANLLDEQSRPDMLAIWRLAITEAPRSPDLVETLTDAEETAENAVAALVSDAQSASLIGAGDSHDIARAFLALLRGGLFPVMLLRAAPPPGPNEVERRARRAAEALLALYPAGQTRVVSTVTA
jgi:AcrR family transcriptional regulator